MRFEMPRLYSPAMPAFFWPNCPCCPAGGPTHKTLSKLDPTDGSVIWHADHGADVYWVDCDADGNVATLGVRTADPFTTRYYDPDGNLVWSADNGTTISSSITGERRLSVTPTRVYEIGGAASPGFLTMRARSVATGSQLWTRTGATNYTNVRAYRDDTAVLTIATDAGELLGGKAFVDDPDGSNISSGGCRVPISDFDFASDNSYYILDASTNLWRHNTSTHAETFIAAISNNGIAIDEVSGDVFTRQVHLGSVRMISRYTSAGSHVWSVDTGMVINRIACGGNLIGVSGSGGGITEDFHVYDLDGNLQWRHEWGGTPFGMVIVPDDSAVYVCGARVAL